MKAQELRPKCRQNKTQDGECQADAMPKPCRSQLLVIGSLRRTRQVQDTLLTAAHRACDDRRLEMAARLLRLAEELVTEEADPRRRRQDRWALIAAHERLWHLRHGEPDDGFQAYPETEAAAPSRSTDASEPRA